MAAIVPAITGLADPQIDERLRHDGAGRGVQVQASEAMLLRIRPEPRARSLNRSIERIGIGAHVGLAAQAGVPPARLDGAAVIENGVVEVEEEGLWQLGVHAQ